VEITFDPSKRDKTLKERGLDFRDAAKVFSGDELTRADTRFDYGEERFVTAGYLAARMVALVWTPRGSAIHVISMRHAHAKEERKWRRRMG
jgi:uncharacterized DUF497 family protein